MSAAGCAPATHDVEVDRYEAVLTVRPDGSVDVQETIEVRPTSAAARVVRRLPLERIDRIDGLDASQNGEPIPASQVQTAERPESAEIVWLMDATAGSTRLGFSYRAEGAFAIAGTRGRFRWPVLPVPRANAIAQARVEVRLAEGVSAAEPPGIDAPGWTVNWAGSGIVATKTDVAAAETAEALAEIRFAAAPPPAPEWQYDTERARELLPAFLSGGAFILVIGAGVLWILRFQLPGLGVPEREQMRRGLYAAGLVVVALGLVCTAIAPIWLWRYSWPPVAMAGSIVAVGLMLLLAAPFVQARDRSS